MKLTRLIFKGLILLNAELKSCYNTTTPGVPEWTIGSDCKSDGLALRGFESLPLDTSTLSSVITS